MSYDHYACEECKEIYGEDDERIGACQACFAHVCCNCLMNKFFINVSREDSDSVGPYQGRFVVNDGCVRWVFCPSCSVNVEEIASEETLAFVDGFFEELNEKLDHVGEMREILGKARKVYILLGWAHSTVAVPRLVQFMNEHNQNETMCKEFAAWLGEMGPSACDAALALIQLLDSDSSEIRAGAAMALGSIGPSGEATVVALQEALRDKSDEVRSAGAGALYLLGSEAKAAASSLVMALLDNSEAVRGHAENALNQFTPEGEEAVSALIGALKARRVTARRTATRVLAQMGPLAQEAIPALTKALKDRDPYVRSGAKDALSKIRSRRTM